MAAPAAATTTTTEAAATLSFEGGCHCKAVRWTLTVQSDKLDAVVCDCSICLMKGFVHVHVPRAGLAVRLDSDAAGNAGGEDGVLGTYTFGTHTAKHHFCRRCGISSFYVPRSMPDGYSVNLNCFDRAEDRALFRVRPFDGQNWENGMKTSGLGDDVNALRQGAVTSAH